MGGLLGLETALARKFKTARKMGCHKRATGRKDGKDTTEEFTGIAQ